MIELSWTPSVSPDVTEQRLYRATTTGAYTTPLQVFSSTTSSYTDAGLENWIPYFYVVRAFDGTAESGDSNEASATAADNAAIAIPGASTWALLVLVAALGALTLVRRRRMEAARPA